MESMTFQTIDLIVNCTDVPGSRLSRLNSSLSYYFSCSNRLHVNHNSFLTIIPRAQMGSESIAHEAEGRMGY